MLLSVDTSLGSTVAVVDLDGNVRAEAQSANRLGHAEVIGDLMVRTLEEAGQPRITHVAAGMGPGPFTGLRIGIAAARTFALARSATLVPVVSHDALALAALTADPARPPAVVTDARRREYAVTTYRGLDGDGIPVADAASHLIPQADAELALAGWDWQVALELSAGALGVVGARGIAAGRVAELAEPLYLRSPDVQEPKARVL